MFKRYINVMIACLMAMSFLGCSLTGKKRLEPAPPNPDTVKQFQAGLRELDAERYEQALRLFEGIQATDPASEFEVITLFNSAAALEGLGRCREAAQRYRKVAQLNPKPDSKIRAQAMFRLSYTFECLNDDRRVIAALLEANRRSVLFSPEIAQAEIPARLAAAYARQGEMKTAQKYLADAERGVAALRAIWENSAQKRELIARTYFLMGRAKVAKIEIDPKKPETISTFDRFAQNMDLLQGYLLKAVHVNRDPWSSKASTEMLDGLDIMWTKLEEFSQVKMPEISHPDFIRTKSQLAERAIRTIETAKLMRLPDQDEPRSVSNLFAEVEKREKRFRNYLAQLGPINPLTSEAKARQSLKKTGRVVSDKTPLETQSPSRHLPKRKTESKKNDN